MGPNIASTTMRRLWSMLAHINAQQVNFSKLGESLSVNYKTIRNYIDLLTDFYMVRQIQPWAGNTKKRLVKSPKIYIRDSGLTHRFLNVPDFETLWGHPAIGASWEAFILENIISQISNKWRYSYYRTNAGAEIDLVLEGPKNTVWAIEIKRSSAPKVTKGFHLACEDIQATHKFVIYPRNERFTLPYDIQVIGLIEFLNELKRTN